MKNPDVARIFCFHGARGGSWFKPTAFVIRTTIAVRQRLCYSPFLHPKHNASNLRPLAFLASRLSCWDTQDVAKSIFLILCHRHTGLPAAKLPQTQTKERTLNAHYDGFTMKSTTAFSVWRVCSSLLMEAAPSPR